MALPRGHSGQGKALGSPPVPGGWCPPSCTRVFIQRGPAVGLNPYRCCCFFAQDQRPPRELRAHRWQVEAGGGEPLAVELSDPTAQLLLLHSLLPSEALGISASSCSTCLGQTAPRPRLPCWQGAAPLPLSLHSATPAAASPTSSSRWPSS